MERALVVTARCETVPVATLNSSIVEEMWRLFDDHYTGVSRDAFERDLRRKQQAIILWRESQLVGFTSQLFEQVDASSVVYSGDVIIAPDSRDLGTARFFQHWARAVWRRCDWWCALSSGPRTFRIPHTFYWRVTPNRDGEELAEEQMLRHRFARHVYGNCYDPKSGIVKLGDSYTLKNDSQQIRGNYPMDTYFRDANPGWRRGDELVSLVSLHPRNWKPVAMRMLHWKGGSVR